METIETTDSIPTGTTKNLLDETKKAMEAIEKNQGSIVKFEFKTEEKALKMAMRLRQLKIRGKNIGKTIALRKNKVYVDTSKEGETQ